jgi:dCTP deaminase
VILSRPDILDYLQSGKLRTHPPILPENIAQVSIDLRLGRKFTTFKNPPAFISSVHVDHSLWESVDLWHHWEQDAFRLEPGDFVLAQTLERIGIPHDWLVLWKGAVVGHGLALQFM